MSTQNVVVRFSPVMALFARCPSGITTVPLDSGQTCSLEELLRHLEQKAPGAFLQPGTSRLRRHIRVSVNRQAGVRPDRQLGPGDVVELEMQAVGGG